MPQHTTAEIHKIAAFAYGDIGGNPAGVMIADRLPSDDEMQAIATRIGYSETAFAAPEGDHWRVRYFAPECEVDFCGHATIALGAALAKVKGPGRFPLRINSGDIDVASTPGPDGALQTELTSPPTKSQPADPETVQAALALFGIDTADLDPDLPPALANAGNDHLVLALASRKALADMHYDFDAGRAFMQARHLTTINLVYAETSRLFHSRNAFAVGGVLEDPATGAAAAALAGFLRDIDWPHGGQIEILQGTDMGLPSRLGVRISAQRGTPVRVFGTTRTIT